MKNRAAFHEDLSSSASFSSSYAAFFEDEHEDDNEDDFQWRDPVFVGWGGDWLVVAPQRTEGKGHAYETSDDMLVGIGAGWHGPGTAIQKVADH
jgi:hypothetical protein